MNDLAVKTLSDTTIRRRPYTGGNRLSPFMQLENSPVASSVSVSLACFTTSCGWTDTGPFSLQNIDGGASPSGTVAPFCSTETIVCVEQVFANGLLISKSYERATCAVE